MSQNESFRTPGASESASTNVTTLKSLRNSRYAATNVSETPIIGSRFFGLEKSDIPSANIEQISPDKLNPILGSILDRSPKRDVKKPLPFEIADVRATTFDHPRQTSSLPRNVVNAPILKSKILPTALTSSRKVTEKSHSAQIRKPPSFATEQTSPSSGYEEFKTLHSKVTNPVDRFSLKNTRHLSSSLSQLNADNTKSGTDRKDSPAKRYSGLLAYEIPSVTEKRGIFEAQSKSFESLSKLPNISQEKTHFSNLPKSEIHKHYDEDSKQNTSLQNYLLDYNDNKDEKKNENLESSNMQNKILALKEASSNTFQDKSDLKKLTNNDEKTTSTVRFYPSQRSKLLEKEDIILKRNSDIYQSPLKDIASDTHMDNLGIQDLANGSENNTDMNNTQLQEMPERDLKNISPLLSQNEIYAPAFNELSLKYQSREVLMSNSNHDKEISAVKKITKQQDSNSISQIGGPAVPRIRSNTVFSEASSDPQLKGIFRPKYEKDSINSPIANEMQSKEISRSRNENTPSITDTEKYLSMYPMTTLPIKYRGLEKKAVSSLTAAQESTLSKFKTQEMVDSAEFSQAFMNSRSSQSREIFQERKELSKISNFSKDNISYVKLENEKRNSQNKEMNIEKSINVTKSNSNGSSLVKLDSEDSYPCFANSVKTNVFFEDQIVDNSLQAFDEKKQEAFTSSSQSVNEMMESSSMEKRIKSYGKSAVHHRKEAIQEAVAVQKAKAFKTIQEEFISDQSERSLNEKDLISQKSIMSQNNIKENDKVLATKSMVALEDILDFKENSNDLQNIASELDFESNHSAFSGKSRMGIFSAHEEQKQQRSFSKREHTEFQSLDKSPDFSFSDRRRGVFERPNFHSTDFHDDETSAERKISWNHSVSQIDEKMNENFIAQEETNFTENNNVQSDCRDSSSRFEKEMNKENHMYSKVSSQSAAIRTERLQRSIVLNQRSSSSSSTVTKRMQIGQRTIRRTSRYT
ncbi:hypothetical protein X975_09541, partial [Stegodyphus mimosarum]